MELKRNIFSSLEKAIKVSPVVLLLGARQSGKTTLVKELSKEKGIHYVSFDDPRIKNSAQQDPMTFISETPKPVIFDEIQRVPELFLAIKHDVDLNRFAGRYILTGSANPLLLPKLGDSLAGRMQILYLYPLSQGELINHQEHFVDNIWEKGSPMELPFTPYSRNELYKKIIIGGYPEVQNLDLDEKRNWFKNYVTLILQKDILDLAQIEEISAIPRLLNILASRTGSLSNITEVGHLSGIPASTLKRYLILLETLFILFFQGAWHFNLTTKMIKSPKTYLVDSGLLSWLLMLNEESFADYQRMGHIIENFVVTELKKQLTWNQARVNLYHFRTTTGIEVDIVLERADGKIIGIEVKNSGHVDSSDAKGLKYLKDYVKEKWHYGIVLYTGDKAIPLSEKIIALPISCLWG